MTIPATERQMSYLRSLVAAKGEDIHDYLIAHGISETGWHGPTAVRPSMHQASLLISELAPERSGGSNYRGRRHYGRR